MTVGGYIAGLRPAMTDMISFSNDDMVSRSNDGRGRIDVPRGTKKEKSAKALFSNTSHIAL